MTAHTAQPRTAHDPGRILWAVAGGCWLLIIALIVVGDINVADHDSVIEHSPLPWSLRLVAFTAAWLVMVGAMMLPTTVPMARMYTMVTAKVPHPGRARAAFFGAYLAVWTAFALLALGGDTRVHALVHSWPWLHSHEQLVLAGALALAGAFQFSPLKVRCLTACRDPFGFLHRYYRRGARGGWTLGLRHALFCLGCCWALMLVMFATGVAASPGWPGSPP